MTAGPFTIEPEEPVGPLFDPVTITLTRVELAAVREAAAAGMPHLASTDFAALNRGMMALDRAARMPS